jgi:hypothetical protein
MALAPDVILAHPLCDAALRRQARACLAAHAAQPRLAPIFATQQRWLLAMLAMALYLGREGHPGAPGLRATLLLDEAVRHDIASRNTAHSFLQEMQQHGLIALETSESDKRLRLLHAEAFVIAMLADWLSIQFETLDALDGGQRVARFTAAPNGVARVQPLVLSALLASRPLRVPGGALSFFIWLDEGGLVLDWLIANMAEDVADNGRIAVAETSTALLSQQLSLSEASLTRKLKDVRLAGGIGWSDLRGRIKLWMTPDFRDEYFAYQATKLALLDRAFQDSGL